jgi:hypothetical protein
MAWAYLAYSCKDKKKQKEYFKNNKKTPKKTIPGIKYKKILRH